MSFNNFFLQLYRLSGFPTENGVSPHLAGEEAIIDMREHATDKLGLRVVVAVAAADEV